MYTTSNIILATGAINKNPNLDYLLAKNSLSLRNIDEAKRLREYFSKIKNLTILGAGFIGLEVAAMARSKEIKTTIIEMGEKVMARAVSSDLSKYYIE